MKQLRLCVIVLNFAIGFLRSFLTDFKISTGSSEERNNRAKGKEKTKVLFI